MGKTVRNRGPRRMTGKVRRLLEAYVGEARLNLTRAGEVAGYARPAREAWAAKQRWREEFEKAEEAYRAQLKMGSEELDERITELARNQRHKDHYKALELLARMHGKLNDKIQVTLDRRTLNSQLDELVALMVQAHANSSAVLQVTAVSDVVKLPAEGALPMLTTPPDQDSQPS